MQKLIDENKYEPKCAYCLHARIPDDKSCVLCKKKGIMSFDDSCKKFKYDPLKRVPVKIRINNDFDEDDFKI